MKLLKLLALIAVVTTGNVYARGSSGGYSYHSYGTGSSLSSTSVSGYTKSNGTHVDSYHRTTPDGTERNNYTASGNVNPYTGSVGTKVPTH